MTRRGAARAVVPGAALLAALAAPWLAPRPPGLQEDPAGARLLPPLTRAAAIPIGEHSTWIVRSLERTREGWTFVRAGRPGFLPRERIAGPPEARFYLLGTDALGRDLASRLPYALRHSGGVAALAVALALVIGIAVGAGAAFGGRIWDAALMRSVDVLMSIPRLLLFLICATLLGPSTLLLILVLGATTWTGLARVARAQLMALRTSDLALAARAVGPSFPRLLVGHLLPQIAPVIAVTAVLRFADTILLESGLAFLGLGSPPPAVSLGGMIAAGREALSEAWWVAAWPGLAIAALVVALRSMTAGLLRVNDPPSLQ